ncbi:MAG: hypothetical protein VX589_18230 [Myxococcota bacterium]|nr:hypothetical protein [Myxococcota bacterium]
MNRLFWLCILWTGVGCDDGNNHLCEAPCRQDYERCIDDQRLPKMTCAIRLEQCALQCRESDDTTGFGAKRLSRDEDRWQHLPGSGRQMGD